MVSAILNHKKLFIGGWIVGALIMLGYNVSILKNMLAPHPIAKPGLVMTATQKSDQLYSLSMENIETSRYTRKLKRFIANFERTKSIETNTETKVQDTSVVEEIRLPKLSGILHIMNAQDTPQNFAVINGQKLREKDRIQGFTIHRITPKGVMLTKAGKQWFLKASEINYSIESVQ